VDFSVTCLRDPTSSFEFKIKVQISIFQILYSVDRLAESTNFKNLLESNQTTLLKEKLFLLNWSTSVQICKKILRIGSICFNGPNTVIQHSFHNWSLKSRQPIWHDWTETFCVNPMCGATRPFSVTDLVVPRIQFAQKVSA
jgi:hypothetical protein